MINRSYRGQRYPNKRGRAPNEGRYPNRDRRPPRRGGSQDNGRPPDRHGGHSSGGGPPDGGGSPDGGGPPDDGGPPDRNGGPPRCPDRRGPPGPREPPWTNKASSSTTTLKVVLDTTSLENTFDNTGQSMLQLARVQDQTNHHLQQYIQGQINMQAHVGALHQLANSTHQRNYDHIFASIPIYDGSNREEFFPWLN